MGVEVRETGHDEGGGEEPVVIRIEVRGTGGDEGRGEENRW